MTRTQAHARSDSSTLDRHAGDSTRTTPTHAGRPPARTNRSTSFRRSARARPALSAVRQLAERRGGAGARRRARGRGSGGAAGQRNGRDGVRAARPAPPGRPSASRARGSMAAPTALLTKEFTAARHRRHARRSARVRASGDDRMRKETRAIFLETPVNPTCRVLDLTPVSYVTKESGIALVVDSTFASPINFRPLEHGADVVIHSATKYLERASRRARRASCAARARTSKKSDRR